MKKITSAISDFIDKKDSLLLYLTLIFPSLLFMPLQSMLGVGGLYIPLSMIFGMLIGLLFILTVGRTYEGYWRERLPLKYITLLSPAVLLLGFAVPKLRSSDAYSICYIVMGVLGYFAFVRTIKDSQKRVSVTVLLASCLFAVVYCLYTSEQFSPDSYGYYEISKNIFSDFGRVNTARQYIHFSDYNVSFPYLYPLLIAVVNLFTGLKIYSGIAVNLIITCLICFTLYKLSVRYFNNPYIGAMASLFLCVNQAYLSEVMSARAVPLAIFTVILCIYLLLSLPRMRLRHAFLAGICAGAGMVTRFDCMVFAACAAGAVLLFAKGKRIKSFGLFLLGMLIPMMPWIIYSYVHFGSLWISDNGGTALLTFPVIPQRYSSKDYTLKTIFNNTSQWFEYYFKYKLAGLWRGFRICLTNGRGILWLIWVGIMALGLIGKKLKGFFAANKKLMIVLGLGLVYCVGKFFALSIVGFGDDRYNVETWILLLTEVTALLTAMYGYAKRQAIISEAVDGQKLKGKRRAKAYKNEKAAAEQKTDLITVSRFDSDATAKSKFLSICISALAVIAIGCQVLSPTIVAKNPSASNFYKTYYVKSKYQAELINPSALYGKNEMQELRNILLSYGNPNPRILFASDPYSWVPYNFGAYTGLTVFSYPVIYNDDQNGLYELVDGYIKPDYVVVTNGDCKQLEERYGLIRLTVYDDYYIYEVTNRSSYGDMGVE